MTPRRTNNLLWLAAASLAAAAVGVAAWGVMPPSVDAADGPAQTNAATRPAVASADTSPFDSAAWSRDLRRPLYDPPPPEPVAAAPAAAPLLSIKLLGTAVDQGRGQALLSLPNGRTRFAGVGESAGGAEVLSVEPGRAVVRFAGRNVTLTVPKEGAR